MSPILDIQRRQRELGRIRMGDKGGKGQPQKLSEFRLTSPARHLLEHAAALWGGEVREWAGSPSEGQYELYTKTAVLPIVIPPSAEPVSQWYEQWNAGGATHRCDGVRNHISDSPCSCDPDKRACKATTRVNVMLPDLPDVGVWRLETHGINAAYELPGTIEIIQAASATGQFLTGRLRIEHRTSKKGGQTRRFTVPVIDLDVTTRALMSGEASGVASLGSGEDKILVGGGEVEQQATDQGSIRPSSGQPRSLPAGNDGEPFEPQSEGDMAPLSPAAPASGSDDIDGAGTKTITQAQIGRLMAVAREHGVSTDDLKLVVQDIAGVRSRKDIPVKFYDQIIAAISGEMVADPRREDIG